MRVAVGKFHGFEVTSRTVPYVNGHRSTAATDERSAA
jgi:hypothetical protein